MAKYHLLSIALHKETTEAPQTLLTLVVKLPEDKLQDLETYSKEQRTSLQQHLATDIARAIVHEKYPGLYYKESNNIEVSKPDYLTDDKRVVTTDDFIGWITSSGSKETEDASKETP